jgi:hypothetical protein
MNGGNEFTGIIQLVALAETILGSDIVPGLKQFFVKEYKLSEAQAADLDKGLEDLQRVKGKLAARRRDITGNK